MCSNGSRTIAAMEEVKISTVCVFPYGLKTKLPFQICCLNLSIQPLIARTWSSILEGIFGCFLLHFCITSLHRPREGMEKHKRPIRAYYPTSSILPVLHFSIYRAGANLTHKLTIQTYLFGSSFYFPSTDCWLIHNCHVLSNWCPIQVRHSFLQKPLVELFWRAQPRQVSPPSRVFTGGLDPEIPFFLTYW